jgi:Glycogen recognition site of AMP-activated protein kinase
VSDHGDMGGTRSPRDLHDVVLDRALESLRELPEVDRQAVSQIVAAAGRAREQDAEPQPDDLLTGGRSVGRIGGSRPRWIVRALAGAGLAAAAAVVGYLAGTSGRTPKSSSDVAPFPAVAPTAGTNTPVLAAALSSDATPIPTQFVFESRTAQQVSLVGDFNRWGADPLALTREPGSSLWSTSVRLTPGRHVYAFLVDSAWTVDPRAPTARDPDFGVTSSVLIVGTP